MTRDPIGLALAAAIASVRAELDDDSAGVTVCVPSMANAALLRRALADAGPFFAVWFETPEQILRSCRSDDDDDDGRPEPPGWLRPTVGRLLEARGDRKFLRPGWRDPLVLAVRRLESEGRGAADLTTIDSDDDAQASLLRFLLEGIDQARALEGLRAPSARFRSLGLEGVGAAGARGAVVVGDRILPGLVGAAFTRWLQARCRRRLRLPATTGLALLPAGLALAAGDCAVVDVDAPAPVVTLLRTPDDLREAVEIVRQVQRAIVAGTALDRIAVIVPDDDGTAPLSRAFLRAGIPATFLVARPWRSLPIAGWLQLVVDVGAGDDSAATIASLLLHPCTSLVGLGNLSPAEAAPGAVTVGRARFRTLFRTVRDVRGLARIADRLERHAADDEPRPGDESAAAGKVTWRKSARANLVRLLRALDALVTTSKQTQPLSAHARGLTALLTRVARPSASRARLLQALLPLVAEGGPPLSPLELAEEITVLLDAKAPLEPLVDAAVRVLAPLQALGGSFDVVVMAGGVDGRLPTARREDPVLPDRLLARLGLDSLTSTHHKAKERWRFAGAVSSSRQELVVSVPAQEFQRQRLTQPSPFLATLGLAEWKRTGSRAWPWRDDVDQPLGDGERRAHDGGAHEHADAVTALERALRAGTSDALPSTLVLPMTLTPESLVELVADPLTFFFRRVLFAWPAASLHPRRSPLEPRGLVSEVRRAIEEIEAQEGSVFVDDVGARLQAVLQEAQAGGVALDADDIAEAHALARSMAAEFESVEPTFPSSPPAAHAPSLGGLALSDRGGRIVVDDDGSRALVRVVEELPPGLGLRLHALQVSLALCGDEVTVLRLIEPGGRNTAWPRERLQPFVDDAVARASRILHDRVFAAGDAGGRFSLDAERDSIDRPVLNEEPS
ncbi:MAG: hypothetical protein Q8O67_24445 [Deltaproteobacteria bacterium]|nr:hypothetical protein [Deltaproteobacteria bacterium]